MTTLLATLSLILGLGVAGYFKARRDRKAGSQAAKLDQAEEALESVEKTKNAYGRLTLDQRERLHTRYGRRP